MAEAEDVVNDAARHAAIYIRRLWLRHRGPRAGPRPLSLPEVRQRIDLLIHAVHGISPPIRVAQVPARPTLLARLFRRHDVRQSGQAVPATDGHSLWLPMELAAPPGPDLAPQATAELFRTIALQQSCRILRRSAQIAAAAPCPRSLALYMMLEAQASDERLLHELPGMAASVNRLRRRGLALRPAPATLPPASRFIETLVQKVLSTDAGRPVDGLPWPPPSQPDESLDIAQWLLCRHAPAAGSLPLPHTHALFADAWTGELLPPARLMSPSTPLEPDPASEEPAAAVRSARLPRSPRPHEANEDDAPTDDGMSVLQSSDPLEKAEDPSGMQRPTDRDDETAGEEFADALSELPEARLIRSPTPAREVLLSDDAPQRRALPRADSMPAQTTRIHYPEWDYRIEGYHHPGATVLVLPPEHGPQAWVDRTLNRYRSMLDTIRRRFEMLRAERVWLRRRLDGDEIDIDACTQARADARAGLPLNDALYRQLRRQRRNLAIMLLVDISGSTDSYLTDGRRIIDVEREALLLVAIALQHMGEPYSIQAFSGDGPNGVTISSLKHFSEPHSADVALRIAALEPQHYTRSGAALRHATAELMRQPAEHRLLLLLSDGKPNDADIYEGRYGVEDTRRAVEEARVQGVHPFCLTIDRQAAAYLPKVFGHGQYALLSRPAELPTVLLDWMRRLVARG